MIIIRKIKLDINKVPFLNFMVCVSENSGKVYCDGMHVVTKGKTFQICNGYCTKTNLQSNTYVRKSD